jgi:hypothetical protein
MESRHPDREDGPALEVAPSAARHVESGSGAQILNQRLYSRLQQIAANEQVATYSDVAPLVGLDMSFADDRATISALLDEISGYEHGQGRPLLSVVIVQSESGRPGKGFYKFARSLGLYSGRSDVDEMEFFISSVREAHRVWRTRVD